MWSILGQREYKFIYKKSIIEELKDIGITDPNILKEKMKKINETIIKASINFGQPYFNTATVAGLYRMFLK